MQDEIEQFEERWEYLLNVYSEASGRYKTRNYGRSLRRALFAFIAASWDAHEVRLERRLIQYESKVGAEKTRIEWRRVIGFFGGLTVFAGLCYVANWQLAALIWAGLITNNIERGYEE